MLLGLRLRIRCRVGIHCGDYEHDDTDNSWVSTSGYINWIVNDTVSWGLKAGGLAADSATEIGARPIPDEPMVRLSSPVL